MHHFRLRAPTILKSLLAATFAVAGLLLFLAADAPAAKAIDGTSAQIQRATKGDHQPAMVKGSACSALGWPHYEQRCLFDRRRSPDDVQVVRVIALR